MSAALSFTLSLFMSFALVPLCMHYAGVLGLVDKPDGMRKIHTHIIPRSGGLAIALAALLPLVYLFSQINELKSLLLGSIVIVIFGLIDDKYELNYKWKFLGQIAAVIIFLTGIQEISKLPFNLNTLPELVTYSILFFFILGATNAVNLADGLDGLAAGTILLSLGFIAYLAYEANINSIFILACGLIGSLLGFLRYNTHPASVFMGDTGSQFIGYMSATLAVTVTQYHSTATSPVLPLIILGLPILDTFMVIAIRIYSGKSPFSPDKNHLHHQFIKLGFHHYETVAIIYFLQIILISTAYTMRFSIDSHLLVAYLLFSLLLISAIFVGRKKHLNLHSKQKSSDFLERRNLILRKLSWVYLYSSHIITFSIGFIWMILIYSNKSIDNSLVLLAQIALITTLILKILPSKFLQLETRIAVYSTSVLSLYSCVTTETPILSNNIIDQLILYLSIVLIISIRTTRKEKFQLDNQDILVLFILLIAPLLPIGLSSEFDFGMMLLRISVMLYAVEYLISKNKGDLFILNSFSLAALFSISTGLYNFF